MGLLCSLKGELAKRMGDPKLSSKDKKEIHTRLNNLAKEWESNQGDRFQNVRQANWNNFETFEWLYNKYVHKELDFDQHPPNYKDIRKFEFGLDAYNKLIAKKDGAIWSKFHLPRAAMQNVPELLRFETQLINETQQFREFTIDTNRLNSDFLTSFKDFSLSLGEQLATVGSLSSAGRSTIKKIQGNIDSIVKQMAITVESSKLGELRTKLSAERTKLKTFLSKGSGEAYKVMNSVLQGADIETIPNMNASQKNQLYNMQKNYTEIRKLGSTKIIRGLQKIQSMAKDKDLDWVEGTIDKIKGMVKSIEFQKRIDAEGKTIDYKNMVNDRDFLELGLKPLDATERFSAGDNKVKFSEHYMSKYILGVVKDVIKPVERAVEEGKLSLPEKIDIEMQEFDRIINVAKNRNPIIENVYDIDPYFFLKKYTTDVGIFNYKAHVKHSFKKAKDAIVDEHLKPSEKEGRQDLVESAEGMIKVMEDVYNEIQMVNPQKEGFMTDAIRTMQSVTYFRLMGGNVRSAARNATQRLYEFVEFGARAVLFDSKKFYNDSGRATSHMEMLNRQKKRFGLQWFDGKSKASNAWEALTEADINVSQRSRGALEDAHMMDKTLYVDSSGELAIKGAERVSEKVARGFSRIAGASGFMHKIVEDWNRANTFKTGFALAHRNLEAADRNWIAKKILIDDIENIKKEKGVDYSIKYKDVIEKFGADHQDKVSQWMEKTAGQMANNATLDLHFEYSKWAKAQAIRIRGDESTPVKLAKAGLGQFAHYRFSMFNLMHKWGKEAGLSWKAGDFTSEESWRMIRFGMLTSMLGVASVGMRTNFRKLASNDVVDTGEAMFAWLNANKEKIETGEITKESQEWLDKVTYGQGGWSFFGPNMPYALSIYEFLTHADAGAHKDPRATLDMYDRALDKAVKKPENQELYEKLYIINSQIARTYAYTSTMFTDGGGMKDAVALELGLFPSKNQREWSNWLYGKKKKRRKKKKFTHRDMSKYDRMKAVAALDNF